MEKLLHIKDTRQRQAAVAMQSGMMPQAGAMQNQAQGAFPQQMNRGLQASPVSGQPQMAMGMNDPNHQLLLQAQREQAMRAQNRPANGVTLPDDLNTLSPQELEHVTRLANQMLSKTSPEDMEKIKMNLNNMNQEQRAYLARKNMDPMTYFFRSQALNQLRRHRRRPDMARGPNAGLDPNSAMMGDPSMNRQMSQNMMNLQRNSSFSGAPGQNVEPNAFIGNVENIQGQQADGLRSQEAGQLVVPASSSQMNQQPFNNQQNMFAQGMAQNNQPNMAATGFNPQVFNQQAMQGANPQQFQTPQSQAQAQAQARAQAAQKAQMAMSAHGGQANPQAQAHLSQQSPVMPMLNQPMAMPQMSPAQAPAQPRPPSHPPNMGQLAAGVSQPGMQAPQIPPGLPQQIQDRLKAMKPEQVTAWLMQQRRAAMARASQQQNALQQSVSQPGQNQAMMNGQMGNNRMRNVMNLPQGMNVGGQPGVQQLQGQLTPQQRQQQQQQNQQRQQELYRMELMRQQSNVEMTPEQAKDMDRAPFPPSLINNNHSQVPPNIKTWGQLKQWATANPQTANGVDLSKLMTLQRLHFNQIITAQAKNQKGQGAGQPFQGPQGQMGNVQNPQSGQPQPRMNLPQMRPITGQDIAMARQKLGPHSNNLSDDQITEILRNRQRQILMQHAPNRAAMGGNMASAQNQSIQQPPPSAPQAAPQVKPQTSQQAQAATQAANKAQTGGAGKGTKAPAGKPGSKKRPNTDDTASNQATTTPQQAQTALPATAGPARPGMPIGQDQMSPQQRLQVEAQMRRQQQAQLRGSTLSRAAAEAAWNNNLPPKVMEVYNEIARNAPSSNPVPVSPEQKAIMTQQLRDSLDVLGRLDVLVLHGFPKVQGQEKNIRNLLAMRIQLMRQFKDSPEWVVNDQFTITPDYLTGAILFIRKLFQVMMGRMQQQRSNANQAATSGPQNPPAGTSALNANNLHQLQQQQEEALQRARRGSSQSGAVPPAPFGAPSPQGVPHAYGPGGLAPEKLKLPPPKKRKQSHAGATSSPVQASAAPAAAARYKQDMANAQSQAAALAGAFKCSVVECQHHFQGFPTQAALDKHVEESHQPEEEEAIKDPLQYFLDSIDIGLGLDEKTQQAKQAAAATTAASTANKLSAASPAKQGMATPVTASATPMARVTSQLGAKAASPAVSTQLTPQQATNKGVKPAPGNDTKKSAGKEEEVKDAWADCPTSLEKLHDAFAPVFQECLGRPYGGDPFEEFMNTEMFGEQAENTPDSFDIALATLTPDGNKDEPKVVKWQDWMPWDDESIKNTAEWMQIPPELATKIGDPDDIDGVRVDFDALEEVQKESLDSTNLPIAAI